MAAGEVLMTLGPIRFSVAESAYTGLQRSLEISVAKHARASGATARQATGYDETIGIDGVVYPEHAGRTRLDDLRALARAQAPQLLTDGRGRVWGRWLLERVEETGSEFLPNGQPLKQAFRLQLGLYGEDRA
jgi:hypothetical protein